MDGHMASLRLRKGIYYVVFWWDGRQLIKSLRTDNKAEATRLKEDVEAQLQRIRRGESALASTLLADGSTWPGVSAVFLNTWLYIQHKG